MISLEKRFLQVRDIISDYTFDAPFNMFLKEYFKKNKQAGKKDRNEVTDIAYSYFRLSYIYSNVTFEQALLDSHYILVFDKENPKHQLFYENKGYPLHESIEERIAFLGLTERFTTHFPNLKHISESIDIDTYLPTILKPLPMFIVSKKKKMEEVCAELVKNDIPFQQMPEAEEVIRIDKHFDVNQFKTHEKGDFWVQDYSTYQSVNQNMDLRHNMNVWDVCAGAGGKSLAFLNKNNSIFLYATDNRHSILENYSSRLKFHFNKNAKIFKMDLMQELPDSLPLFDVIVCDVPCSGSGTWARNPERLISFKYNAEIEIYQKRQLLILTNSIQRLKKDGKLYYITCSIFSAENEEVIKTFSEKNPNYKVNFTKYMNGSATDSEYIFISEIEHI